MESIVHFFLYQWQRKLVALLLAFTIWFLVNHSITSTKTIPSVPIRVINLPTDKTIQGLLPNGFLSKRTNLTLTGTKDIVEQLEPGDIEILLDVSHLPNEGVVQINKKNLVSLNPNVNLITHITSVTHPEIIIKMNLLLTEKVPVLIQPPIGSPPEGYDFLDVWPIKLTQTVTGPQDLVLPLKSQGLELTFNLNEISKEELDSLQSQKRDIYTDEVSFYIPDQWKKVTIPLSFNISETLNDPEAKNLQINFLKKDRIPLKENIPVNLFYPLKYGKKINPQTYKLKENSFVQYENGISVLKVPLFANNVSKLFVDIIKDHLQIEIVAAPKSEREVLEWSIGIVDPTHLENMYAAFLLNATKSSVSSRSRQEREEYFRHRFRFYMQKFALSLSNKQPLALESVLNEDYIIVHILNINPDSIKPSSVNSHAR